MNARRSNQVITAILPSYAGINGVYGPGSAATVVGNNLSARVVGEGAAAEADVGPELNWWGALSANSFSPLYMIRVIYVLVVHFILSLHNGWIQPRLRLYDQGRHQRDQVRSRQQLPTDISATEAAAGRGAAAAGPPAAEPAGEAAANEDRNRAAQAAPMNTELRNIINNTIEDIDIIDLAGLEDAPPEDEE